MTDTQNLLAGSLADGWPTYPRAGAGIGQVAELENMVIDLAGVLARCVAEELPRSRGEDALREFSRLCGSVQSLAVQRAGLADYIAPAAASAVAAVQLLNGGPAAWVVE